MDVALLEDEKFDFDLPLSSDEEQEDDDEIFFGPVGHKERCVATNAEVHAVAENEDWKPMSPLTAEQIVEIFKEATAVACMLKNTADEEQKDEPASDMPELLKDIGIDKSDLPQTNTKENLSPDTNLVVANANMDGNKSIDKLINAPKDNDAGFMVRRRALVEKNSSMDTTPVSKHDTRGTSGLSKPGKSTRLHLKKINTAPTTRNSSELVSTPRSKSNSFSRTDRSFSRNHNSSSASDTSLTEEPKTSKLTLVSRSGLKPPGFTAKPRPRTNSNSSVSSNSSASSIPSFNPNETFTITPQSESIKKTSKRTSTRQLPASKGSLTNIGKGLAKPTFARPTDVAKTSGKPQPMKALPRVSTLGATRSASASCSKSPVRPMVSRRIASAGSSQGVTPRQSGTPTQGAQPKRRSIAMPGSQVKKPARNCDETSVGSSEVSTPRKGRRSLLATPRSASKTSSKPQSGMGSPQGMVKMRTRSKDECGENAPSTPPNKGVNSKSMSASCIKRRSFIPTPNFSQNKTKSRFDSATCSPDGARIKQHSPSTSSCESSDDPVPLELSLTFVLMPENTDAQKDEEEASATPAQDPVCELANEQNLNFDTECQENISCMADVNLSLDPEVEKAVEYELVDGVSEPKIHDSPLLKIAREDEFVDPFSPGLVSPGLPQDACLNPMVVHPDAADLIDLSRDTPKRPVEVNLIDLAAMSPLREAKLVDI
ncbi:G2 and S phase-expressed protein 1 isoform X2 [Nematostella vectensis]|nr:G2 and S phase-expressed protein 1 isoform X2 [Nematostella vectensis]